MTTRRQSGPFTRRAAARVAAALLVATLPASGSGGLSMGIYFLPLTPELSTPTGSNTLLVFTLPES